MSWIKNSIKFQNLSLDESDTYEEKFDHASQDFINCRNYLRDIYFLDPTDRKNKKFYGVWNGWLTQMGLDFVESERIIREIRDRVVHPNNGSVGYSLTPTFLATNSGSPLLMTNGKRISLGHRPKVNIPPSNAVYKSQILLEHAVLILEFVIEQIKVKSTSSTPALGTRPTPNHSQEGNVCVS